MSKENEWLSLDGREHKRIFRDTHMTPAEKTIRELSSEAFKDHTITERMRSGLFRSWRCQRPGSWNYGFDITTTPGYLIITGDLGCMIVSREADMLPWCRGAIDSTHYFASKVQDGETHEYSPEICVQWCREQLERDDLSEDDRESLQEAIRMSGDTGRDGILEITRDVWIDEPPQWEEYSSSFLWSRDAIRWFLLNHNEPAIPAP